MGTCPVCGSRQLVAVISPRRTVCGDCGSVWVMEDGHRRLLSTATLISFRPPEEARAEKPVPRRRRRKHSRAS